MIVLAKILLWMASILDSLAWLIMIVVFIWVVLSWVNADRFNPIVRFINEVCTPLLAPIQKRVPPVGGRLDLSPLILLLGIGFVQKVIVESLISYASKLELDALREMGVAIPQVFV